MATIKLLLLRRYFQKWSRSEFVWNPLNYQIKLNLTKLQINANNTQVPSMYESINVRNL